MLAGVCGGLASYFEIHPAFYRVGFVVLTLLGGAGILIYLAAALVMPDEGKADSVVTAALRNRRDRPWPLIGVGLLAVGATVLLSRATLWPSGDAWVPLLLVGGAILWITRHDSTTVQAADGSTLAARDSHRIRRVFRGILIAIGSLIALVLIAVAIFAAVVHVHLGNGVGDRTYDVSGIQDLRHEYKLGIGDMRVDLGNVQLPAGATRVKTRVDVGKLVVVVPRDVAVRVHGDAQYGRVNLFGNLSDGHDVDRSVRESGARVLVLDAHVGAGKLRVIRAVR
jgi:phage shock protein PspC (stress-responsive transcriptional regulator)